MHAKKVAGRQGPGGLSGKMDPKTRAAAAAAANALFIFLLSEPPDGKITRQFQPYAHSWVVTSRPANAQLPLWSGQYTVMASLMNWAAWPLLMPVDSSSV
jgi:hypothetical protein